MTLTNLKYVPWDDSGVLPKICRCYRRAQARQNAPIAGKNLAVLVYAPGWESDLHYLIGCSSPDDGLHSEPMIFAALTETLKKYVHGSAVLVKFYTERAPCQSGAGMKNCDRFLHDLFVAHQHGAPLGSGPLAGTLTTPQGGLTEVEFSFHYPSSGKNESDDLLAAHKALDIADDPNDKLTMSLREFFKQLGKQDRTTITGQLKNFDKSVLRPA